MRLGKVTLFILCLTFGFLSCKKDDGGDVVVIEIRDRTEQQIIDNDSLLGYLETHYYNSSAFVSNTNPSLSDLIISELPEDGILPDPDNNTLLIDDVETKSIVFAETDYDIYILKLNQGGGTASPSFADNVRVSYKGYTLDDNVFDSAVTPVVFDLTSLVPGWRKVLPEFNVSESFADGGDGTVDYTNYGVGIMFLPSGLGYFSSATAGIPSYSPIVFQFELFQMYQNDHDNDGIPSYLEDLNEDGEFTANFLDRKDETDDDTDGDGTPDYFDNDDDGDGILTINEDIDGDGDPTNDIGSNGIARYLDPKETESKQ